MKMLLSEGELIKLVKNESNIIIYGSSARASVIIDRLRFYGIQENLFVAVTDTKASPKYCSGLRVYDAHNLTQIATNSIVLISTLEKYHNTIEEHARKLGFSNILRINSTLFVDMKSHSDIEHNPKRERFLQYRTVNMLRLAKLCEKIKSGRRIRVIFLATSPTKFHYAPIYCAMKKKDLFDVSIYFFDEYYAVRSTIASKEIPIKKLEELRAYSEQLRDDGFNVIWGYDKDGFPISITQYSPDIIFYNTYNIGHGVGYGDGEHMYKRIIANHLSCFVPYGIEVANDLAYHFEHENLLPAWIHFVTTRPALDLVANNSITEGINAVLSGHPMLDEYRQAQKQLQIPVKCQNDKKLIIYAPHWNTTFRKHWHCMLALLEKYKDTCNFVFKPHPRLDIEISTGSLISEIGIPTYIEYKTYCDYWENSPNGFIITDDSNIRLFKQADCLITDCYSFIPAWLPTDKPCIFLMNPDGPTDPYKYYYDFMHPVIDSYYICKTEKEIEDTFNDVVIMGNDPKAEERRVQCKNLIYNLGNAGQFIADYVERQLVN